jgi:large subunit ribosomal protein L19
LTNETVDYIINELVGSIFLIFIPHQNIKGMNAWYEDSHLNMKQLLDYNLKFRKSKKVPELNSGDIIKIHRKIKEGNKERVQVFEGIVVAIKGRQSSSPMATVRRVAHGTGVEVTIPLYSPAIEKIELVKKAKTRKAKLYYLREKGFKLSKLKMKELGKFIVEEEDKQVETEKQPAKEEKPTTLDESKEAQESLEKK